MSSTSASADPLADRLASPFWDDLKRLESRRRQLERLEGASPEEPYDLRAAWRNYCEVIAELDDTTAALHYLRSDRG